MICFRGKSKKKEKVAFRGAYSKLKDLRSHLPEVPLLALTATATETTRKAFQRQLGIKSPTLIIRTPNRDNIKLMVKTCSDISCFSDLLEGLRSLRYNFPRTVIYCKSIKDCYELFSYFDSNLGDEGYASCPKTASSRFFAMFFHDTLTHKKEAIIEDLLTPSGHFRLIIASSALGMGINMVDLHHVYHYGPPTDLEDYMQEIGRAGRSGKQAQAVLYFKTIHLLGSSEEMKSFVRNKEECRRKLLERYFHNNDELQSVTPLHECCDLCSRKCQCDSSSCDAVCQESDSEETCLLPTTVREASEEDMALLKEILEDLQEEFEGQTIAYGVPIWSGSLITEMLVHYPRIDGIQYIAKHLPVIEPRLAITLLKAVYEVADEVLPISQDDTDYLDTMDDSVCDKLQDMVFWSNSESDESDFALAEDELSE